MVKNFMGAETAPSTWERTQTPSRNRVLELEANGPGFRFQRIGILLSACLKKQVGQLFQGCCRVCSVQTRRLFVGCESRAIQRFCVFITPHLSQRSRELHLRKHDDWI